MCANVAPPVIQHRLVQDTIDFRLIFHRIVHVHDFTACKTSFKQALHSTTLLFGDVHSRKRLYRSNAFLIDFASQIRLRFDSVTVGCVASSFVPEKQRQIGKLRLVNVENINCVENWRPFSLSQQLGCEMETHVCCHFRHVFHQGVT